MPAYDDLAAAGKISALAGLLAGIAAIAVGSIFLIFALPSIGRPGEFDYLFSQAAGGFLIILLGLLGLFASALAWPSPGGERAASVLGGLFYAAVFLLFAIYQEWKAAALVVILAGVAWLALRRRRDAARMLFLFAGLFGFALTQAAITLLPYGWKTWSISGVLFLFAFLLLSFSPHLIRLPLLTIGRNRRRGILLYSLLALALIALSMASLVHLPGPAGPGSFGVPVQSQYSESFSSAGKDIQDCGCQAGSENSSPSALPQNENESIMEEDAELQLPGNGVLNQNCDGAAILTAEDVRTFQRGETVQFSARSCPRALIRSRSMASVGSESSRSTWARRTSASARRWTNRGSTRGFFMGSGRRRYGREPREQGQSGGSGAVRAGRGPGPQLTWRPTRTFS